MIPRLFYFHLFMTSLTVGVTLFIGMLALDFLVSGSIEHSRLYGGISIIAALINLIWLWRKSTCKRKRAQHLHNDTPMG
jgi:hypothetical protein